MSLRNILAFLFLGLVYVCPADAASRFGVCTVTCTWDGASTAMWSATSGGATGASVPGSSDTVTFDAATCVGGVTCTITVSTTVTVSSITFGACTASTTGCILDFSVNNNNVTAGSVSGTGTGTRSLKMGNGAWTISSSGTAWNFGTVTGLTLTPNNSTINMTGVTGSILTAFSGGGATYNNLTLTANKAANVIGANTFANLGVAGPNFIEFPSNAVTTVTNAFTITGTASNPIMMMVIGLVTPGATISTASGTATCAWCGFHGMVFAGGATFTASNSLDFGLNSGIAITPPSGGGASQSIDVRPGIQ